MTAIILTYGPALSEIQFSDERVEQGFCQAFSFENPDWNSQDASNAEGNGEIYLIAERIEFVSDDNIEGRRFIPTGLYWAVDRWCMKEGLDLGLSFWPPWIVDPEAVEDVGVPRVSEDLIPGITLRDYQLDAIEQVLTWRRGVLEIATGGGKTEIAIGVVLSLGLRTLYLVPTAKAMSTSWKRFTDRGVDAGRLGDGHRELDKPVLIAIVNSLYSGIKTQDDEIAEWFERSEVYICDEAHHQATALSWKMISAYVQAEYRICMSGTPFKNNEVRTDPAILDPYDSWLIGMSGRVLVYLSPKELIKRGSLSPGVFVSFKAGKPERNLMKLDWWPEVARLGIEENENRNRQVAQLAANLASFGRKPLISVEKLEHGRTLQRLLLRDHGVFSACSYGAGVVYLPNEVAEATGAYWEPAPIMVRKRKKVKGKMKRVLEWVGGDPDIALVKSCDVDSLLLRGDIKVLIGSKIFDEAQDIPWLTDLINAAPGGSSKPNSGAGQRLRQKIGRILRKYPGKQAAWFWDPWDDCHYFLKNHSKNRLAIATEEGYPTITDWALGGILTHYDVSSFRIGKVLMKLKEIEVTVALTIPMSIPGPAMWSSSRSWGSIRRRPTSWTPASSLTPRLSSALITWQARMAGRTACRFTPTAALTTCATAPTSLT